MESKVRPRSESRGRQIGIKDSNRWLQMYVTIDRLCSQAVARMSSGRSHRAPRSCPRQPWPVAVQCAGAAVGVPKLVMPLLVAASQRPKYRR
ncbi:hypothetical protein EVAR_9642_1 [Eumeta japonica]|uniref:Uncharacterized protein n=1 Tax=Eumeta variegata TaxID=151549 RepID=A0A4C1TMB3_EUMVA|nr:hypothetical protein EVAR_9642_1 [Eumeta japonica]